MPGGECGAERDRRGGSCPLRTSAPETVRATMQILYSFYGPAVAQIQFLEWTGPDRLRHTKFVALKDDKDPTRW